MEFTEAIKQFGSHFLSPIGQEYYVKQYWLNSGCLNYIPLGKDLVIIGNPVTSEQNYAVILKSFIKDNPKHKIHAFLVYENFMKIFTEINYTVLPLGVLASIKLNTYDTSLSSYSLLRRNINYAQKRQLKVFEKKCLISNKEFEQLEIISRVFLNSTQEYKVLSSQLAMLRKKNCRLFVLTDPQDHWEAFLACAPIYKNGQLIAYTVDLLRRGKFPLNRGINELLIDYAAKTFRQEGVTELHLSWIMQYVDNAKQHGGLSVILLHIFLPFIKIIYPYHNYIKSAKKYNPTYTPLYFCSPSIFPAKLGIKLMKFVGII